jgi:hypothetical protein
MQPRCRLYGHYAPDARYDRHLRLKGTNLESGFRMNHHKFVILAFFAVSMGSGVFAQNLKRRAPIIRQVDRILIESGEPKALFDFLSAELQLPVAWPLAENKGSVSGSVGTGNVNIEIFRYALKKGESARATTRAHYAGLALEPYALSEALPELKARGISFSAPEPYVSALPNGTQGALWTTVQLPSLSAAGTSIFLYEFSPAFLKVDVRRKQLGNRLILNHGGPLGILSVSEIVMSSANGEKDRAAWKRLLGEPAAGGSWTLGTGPAIRVVSGTTDQIQKIILRVKSLSQAKPFLTNKQMLGVASAKEISLNPTKFQGLTISLVE